MVVWNFAGTEIPKASSQTLIIIGTCNTPAALTVSKKTPSDVLALPMVLQETSFPLFENFGFISSGSFLNNFEACAIPNERGI